MTAQVAPDLPPPAENRRRRSAPARHRDRRTWRPRGFTLAAVLLIPLFLPACSRQAAPEPGAVVAEVGEERITVDDVRREVALRRGLPAALATGGAGRSEVEDALRRLAEEAMVVGEGKRRGLSVTDRELEDEVRRHRGDFPPGGLEKALAQAGLDMASWREGVRRSILHRKAAEAVVSSLLSSTPHPLSPPVGPSTEGGKEPVGTTGKGAGKKDGSGRGEVLVKVRELVFAVKGEAVAARELLAAGRSPEGAASLAGGSIRPVSIDLGWFSPSSFPPGLPVTLSRLPRGGVTDVVSFDGGHAVFVVEDRREAGEDLPTPAGRVSADPSVGERREETLRIWLEETRGKTKVRIDEELLSTLYSGRP